MRDLRSRAAPGWRHVVAAKAGGLLKLYIDGQCRAQSSPFDPAEYDLSTPSPLRIGFGQHDYFNGRMKDLRLYRRALDEAEIRALVSAQEPSTAHRRNQAHDCYSGSVPRVLLSIPRST